jgi:hypothetical protein
MKGLREEGREGETPEITAALKGDTTVTSD